jgi:hypothetical protein
MWVVAGTSSLLFAMSAWFLVTGRRPPGILGRGFTSRDDQRLHRAPPIYFRAMGNLVAWAALDGFVLVWVIGTMPQPSSGTLEILLAVLTLPTGVSLAWLIYLSARYGISRWDGHS